MPSRSAKPANVVETASQAEAPRRSTFIDPSPLMLDQFKRNRDGENPMGSAESIEVRRSSSHQRTHIKDDPDNSGGWW